MRIGRILWDQEFSDGDKLAPPSVVIVCSVFLAAALAAPGAALAPGKQELRPNPNPNPASQRNDTSGTQTLTVEQALQMAEESNFLLRGADADVEGARAGIRTARAYINPSVTVMGGRQFARPIRTPAVPGILQHYSVQQTLELPAIRRTRIEVAKLASQTSELGRAAVRLEVRSAVKQTFLDALRRREEIEHAQENLKLLQDLRRRIDVQVNVGEAAKLELTRADAEIATATNAVKSAQLLYNNAVFALRAAISAPLPDRIDPRGDLSGAVTLPPLADARTPVLERHPIIQQARSEFERANAQLSNQKALRYPEPTFDAEYENQPDLRFYRVGVSVPLPFWDRRQGPIAEAQAAIKRADALVNQRRIELTAALESSYGQYMVADQQVKSLEAGALRQANAALDAAQSAYRFGARGILEVLDAQRVLQRVRGDLVQAQYERQSALADLQELGAVR